MTRLLGFPIADHRRVFIIALPMIISNIAAPLLGLVDTAIIGHLPDAIYLSAVAVGATVIGFIYFLAVFMRMSMTALVAQNFGADDMAAQRHNSINGLFLATLLGVLLILLTPAVLELSWWLMVPAPALQNLASDYISIRLWGAPAALMNLVILGVLLGRQQSRQAMWLVIATNAVNVIVDVWLIVILDWRVQGAAVASAAAEWSSCLLGLFWLRKSLALGWHHLRLNLQQLLVLLRLNGDIFVRSLTLQLCMASMTAYATRYGAIYVAVNAVLMQFLLLISLGLDGIAYAVEALVGQAKGQGRSDRVRHWCRLTLLWSCLFAVAYSLIFIAFGEHIIRLLTDIDSVIDTAGHYLPWLMVLPLIGHWSYYFDGVFIGLAQSRGMRNTMLFAALLGFLPLWWWGQRFENHGLWLALTGFLMMRGVAQAIWLKRHPQTLL